MPNSFTTAAITLGVSQMHGLYRNLPPKSSQFGTCRPRAFSFSCLVGKAHHVESFAEMGIVAA